MARNRRDRRWGNQTVVHITNRTCTGLPFPCRLIIRAIIKGIMAKAQSLYPIKICHYLWMSNHYHLILSGSPALISPFMNYIDGEVAKSLKRLVPYFQSRVWQGRFKEQRLCTATDVIKMISYLYNNPVKAGLVDSVNKWNGVSSWKTFIKGQNGVLARWIRPSLIKKIWPGLSQKDEIKIVSKLLAEKSDYYELDISPYSWLKCFNESLLWTEAEAREKIIAKIAEDENVNRSLNKNFKGEKALANSCYYTEFKNSPNSDTPFVICHDPLEREKLINSYKSFVSDCKDAYQGIYNSFSQRDKLKISFPKGCYPPQILIISSGLSR